NHVQDRRGIRRLSSLATVPRCSRDTDKGIIENEHRHTYTNERRRWPADSSETDQEGFCLGPGSPVGSWLWRLRDSGPGPEGHAGIGIKAGEYRIRVRNWLLQQVSVLYEYLRSAQHPWPRSGSGDRDQGIESRTVSVGHYR